MAHARAHAVKLFGMMDGYHHIVTGITYHGPSQSYPLSLSLSPLGNVFHLLSLTDSPLSLLSHYLLIIFYLSLFNFQMLSFFTNSFYFYYYNNYINILGIGRFLILLNNFYY